MPLTVREFPVQVTADILSEDGAEDESGFATATWSSADTVNNGRLTKHNIRVIITICRSFNIFSHLA